MIMNPFSFQLRNPQTFYRNSNLNIYQQNLKTDMD